MMDPMQRLRARLFFATGIFLGLAITQPIYFGRWDRATFCLTGAIFCLFAGIHTHKPS
jgi:hypothetical protein